jgi:N-methylhydantoinase A
VNRLLSDIDAAALCNDLQAVANLTQQVVTSSGTAFKRIDRLFEFDMLYLGQTHTVAVAVDLNKDLTINSIQAAFDSAYKATYGRLLDGIPVRVMNYRVTVIGRRPVFDMSVFAPVQGKRAQECCTGARKVWADGAFHEVLLYDRLSLAVGEQIAGPAILEQPDTTIFVDPGLVATVDAFGNLIISPEGRS